MWENIKLLWSNLPLVLSETDRPQDISLNRVMFVLYGLFVLATPFVVLWLLPAIVDRFLPFWQGVAALLGGQTFAQLGKKAIYAYSEKKEEPK